MKTKIKKMSNTRKFLLAEAIFVLGVFVYLYFSNVPKVVSPFSGQAVSDPNFVFEIENGNEIFISNNVEFKDPMILNEGDDITLYPGTYYWKARNWLGESKVSSFTIESNVALNLRKGAEKTILENAGNVDLNVKTEKNGITSSLGIDAGKSEVVTADSNYQGGQSG
jgi:hypothetical protein